MLLGGLLDVQLVKPRMDVQEGEDADRAGCGGAGEATGGAASTQPCWNCTTAGDMCVYHSATIC